MKTNSSYKPVGGVESVALYPADAVVTALFSSNGCEVELSGNSIEVPLLDDASQYDEISRLEHGAASVLHKLHLVADRKDAEKWLDSAFLERAAFEGFIAVVSLSSGQSLLVGYSAHLGNEQPLRLESLTTSSGKTLHETPSVTLRLVSCDADLAAQIL